MGINVRAIDIEKERDVSVQVSTRQGGKISNLPMQLCRDREEPVTDSRPASVRCSI